MWSWIVHEKRRRRRRRRRKGLKTPEANDKSCESPSLQPQLVQLSDQGLEVPQPIEDSSFSVKNKKKYKRKRPKARDCNDRVCAVSVGTSVMESNMPAVDPSIQPSVEISSKQLEVAEPLVEGMSTTTNSKCPKPNADFSCLQMKKKKPKRSRKTNENKELSVETMMPEADPSLQPSLAMFSEQELEVAQPLNTDAEPLVEGMSTTINSESPKPNADFSCSQETKKKNRKRRCKTSDSRELLVGIIMPEPDPSLQPPLAIFSEQELEVPQPLNTDSEPLVKGMSTIINSERPKPNADFSCSQETKKKNRKRSRKTSDSGELLVEIMTLEADPSLQPPPAIFSEQEPEVPQPLNTDSEPLVEGIRTIINSESPKPNADFSCSQETKKKKRKRRGNNSDSRELLVEIMSPEADPSLQPPLAIFSEQELEVPQPLNTDSEPLVEGMSATINSESPKPNADFSCSQETKKKKRKIRGNNSDSRELLVEIMSPEADPSLQPPLAIFSEQELEVPQPLNTHSEPLVEGMSATINSESPKPNADFSCSQETKKKKRKRRGNNSDSRELLVEIMSPEADPSLQPPLAIFSEQELEVPQPLNTHSEPLVEGMSATINSESPKLNADFSCSQETKKKNPKRKRKTSESKELLMEIMTPEADPPLQPTPPIFSEQELEVEQPLNTDTEWKETKIDEVPSLTHFVPKADTDVAAIVKESNLLPMSNPSTERSLLGYPQKKLLILDVNGLLADIVQMEFSIPSRYKPDKIISGKAVFKRPFCDDFLQFCFDRFNVGVWSSRTKKNVDSVIDFLLGDSRHKLLFCWNQSHCTSTGFKTVENKNKPLVLKELRKLWEKLEPDLPWPRGEYNESNTILLDDSPYKALRNPVNTAIFPNSFQFRNKRDSSLGPGGDIRSYLEGLAMVENVQKYVEHNPFGQRPITKSNPSWNFYRRVIEDEVPVR
ncbi:hypothetical protein M0R45_023383 [Rubus argutus]|uniref:FCP1 homology domain-containing protein n=1 Tax=Rubus argutus TaxID=59490 RepID=A0AAW1WNI1_RUBAR